VESPTSSATSADKSLVRRLLPRTLLEWLVIVGIVGFLTALGGDQYMIEIPAKLAFGWYGFIKLNLNAMQPNSVLIAEGVACTVLLAFGGHYFCRWLWARMAPAGSQAWRVRWTVAGLGSVLLLFVAGIATIGITHQAAWLFTMKGPMIIDSWGPRFVLPEVLSSAMPARAAVATYYERNGRLPASTAETGVTQAELMRNKFVKDMRIEAGGVVVIEIQYPRFEGGVLLLTPSVKGKELDWKCSSDLERIYLPASCR